MGGPYILCSGTEGLPVAYIGISSLDALDLVPAFLIFIPTACQLYYSYILSIYIHLQNIKIKCICNFVFMYESVIYNYIFLLSEEKNYYSMQ